MFLAYHSVYPQPLQIQISKVPTALRDPSSTGAVTRKASDALENSWLGCWTGSTPS